MAAGSSQRPVLDREAELAVLRGAISALEAGRSGAIAVEGEAGIGKSRLLTAAAGEVARSAGAGRAPQLLRSRADRLEMDYPFGVIVQLVEPGLAALEPEDTERLLAGAAHAAAPLFPRFAGGGGQAPLLGSEYQVDVSYPVLQALAAIFAELTAATPLVIAVDDLHWSDAPSIRCLHYLLRRLDSVRALIVMATRPRGEWTDAGLYDALAGDPGLTFVRPAALSEQATAQLMGEHLTSEIEPAFAAAAHRATGGNPLYVRELGRELAARGIAPTAGNAPHLPHVGPVGIAQSVRSRLGQLGPAATQVANAIAVAGDRASIDLVASLAGVEVAGAAGQADRLRAIGILEEAGPLAFTHPILHAAVLDAMPAHARAAMHACAAQLLREAHAPAETVAAHAMSTDVGMLGGALEILREAAREARDRGAPDVAAEYLRRATREGPSQDELAKLLLELGNAEALRREPAAAEHLARARALTHEPDDRVLASLALWSTHSFDGRIEEGLEILRSELDRSPDTSPDLRLRLELELARGARSCRPFAAEGRRRIAALADEIAGDETPLKRLALGLIAYDAMLANVPVDTVTGYLERALPLRDPVLQRSNSQLMQVPHYTTIYCDRLDEAQQMADALARDARERGSVIEVTMAVLWRALAQFRAGALETAERDAQTALSGSEEHGWRFGTYAARLWLSDIAVERGQIDEATRVLEPCQSLITDAVSQKGWANQIRNGRATRLLAAGQNREALDELLAIGRAHDQFLAFCPSEMAWRSNAALAALRLGDTATANRLANEELELARAFGARRALGIALRVAGLVEQGAAGIALVEEAVDVLASSPARLEHARALTDLGAMMRAGGQVKAARDPLRLGLDEALRCDATALAKRARTELIATGSRPRRSVAVGPGALTASELRVARLAASGTPNAEIAQTLFLAVRTVETHLTNAYRKLQISSRDELADALVADG